MSSTILDNSQNGFSIRLLIEWPPVGVGRVLNYMEVWFSTIIRLTLPLPTYHIRSAGPETDLSNNLIHG